MTDVQPKIALPLRLLDEAPGQFAVGLRALDAPTVDKDHHSIAFGHCFAPPIDADSSSCGARSKRPILRRRHAASGRPMQAAKLRTSPRGCKEKRKCDETT